VEIIVEGNPKRIVEFIKEVQRGPSLARVDRLEIHDLPGGGSHSTFQLEGW
jgi:acylphosphatase